MGRHGNRYPGSGGLNASRRSTGNNSSIVEFESTRNYPTRQAGPLLTIYNNNSCIARAMIDASSTYQQQQFQFEERSNDGDDDLWQMSTKGKKINKILNSTRDSLEIQPLKGCTCGAIVEQLQPEFEYTAPLDWQVGLLTPSQRINDLYNYGHLTDVTITFPDSNVVYKASTGMKYCLLFGLENIFIECL